MDTAAPPIPRELRALMAEIGPRWAENTRGHIKIIAEEFSKILAQGPRGGVSVKRNIAYGAHPRQFFDLYTPAEGTARPALIFVHGGGFTDGELNRTDEVYANVMYYAGRHGIVGLNIEYRLAPEAKYPEGSRDVGAVVAWVRQHAGEIGVDPARIFVMGHSAGGAHVATYAYDRRLHPADGSGVAGVIVVSGRVRADNLPSNPNAHRVEAYYDTKDATQLDALSTVSLVSKDSAPTLIAWGEFENPLLDVYCAELAHRLGAAKGRMPPTVYLPGHNHNSTISHMNTADDDLGRALLDFIANPR